MEADSIIIRGARQHNLQNVDLDLPRNKLIVITGLSGSGKSSLAFDTLYAEGQRRYVESLSTYARQFLERLEKPDVDMIVGLSPAIAIEQKTAGHNPRSTVGTVTEIYDYLRLLFARIGLPHCHQCGRPITSQSIDQIIDQIMALDEGTRIYILAPLINDQKGTHDKLFKRLMKAGFPRVSINDKIVDLEKIPDLNKNKKHTIEVVVDRLVINEKIRQRLADSIELAMAESDGWVKIDILDGDTLLFSETSACADCGISYPEFTPAGFSFNSPQGACTFCDGLGTTSDYNPDLIIPDQKLSLREGAVTLWAGRGSVQFAEFLDALTAFYEVDIYTPYEKLPDTFKKVLLHGSGNVEIPFYYEKDEGRVTYHQTFEGLIPHLKRRRKEAESAKADKDISRFISYRPCPHCKGRRLKPASLAVTVNGYNISQITALSVAKALRFFNNLTFKGQASAVGLPIKNEIVDRLGFLADVGLNYLALDRRANTLSGGESQRIRLATQIGAKLSGVLYVLDEPSIGLHQRDNQRLLATLRKMRDLGNTVLVVEHDEDTILAADFVVDMGPGAGRKGGRVVFQGTPNELLKAENSLTGQYFSGRKQIEVPEVRRKPGKRKIVLKGASANNLTHIDVTFPLGLFTCVTGVSGSGKSSLVNETLHKLLSQRLYRAKVNAGPYESITGLDFIDKVVNIDQSPIGKTPRSNPGTYTGILSFIRELFAKTPDARKRGFKPGRFSFNVKGGRCEACGGDGITKIEMHFLPDVYVTCDVCRGKRYNRETLEIRYKGESIADILDMTVNQALLFFDKLHHIKTKLLTLIDVGMGYIHLGQPATTLSGGEAQRIKLAKELSRRSTGRTVYILDEPTTGLHIEDINKLLTVLNRLVEAGNTVIVIEHNLDVIKFADHIIDLGPEGGDKGGNVVGYGTPEELAQIETSHTGRFLKQVLERRG